MGKNYVPCFVVVAMGVQPITAAVAVVIISLELQWGLPSYSYLNNCNATGLLPIACYPVISQVTGFHTLLIFYFFLLIQYPMLNSKYY